MQLPCPIRETACFLPFFLTNLNTLKMKGIPVQKDKMTEKYDVKGAADYLGVKPHTLNIWRSRNRGPVYY